MDYEERGTLNKLTAKINDVSKIFNDELNAKCATMGITPATRKILFYLSSKEPVNQLYIVNKTKLKAPTISVSLGRLEKKGLVRRETCDIDMRNIDVYLSDKGKEVDDEIKEYAEVIDEKMMKDITQEEIDTCMAVLDKLMVNILGEDYYYFYE
ncbi:MAG: MarR family transcriptional regulator [Ruminococcus sp.]|nr:MarR family transcriptional regulator [Ruminococcus sp.]MCD7728083.1 MarR family transcriptional regulator [Ruminococcus sp.]